MRAFLIDLSNTLKALTHKGYNHIFKIEVIHNNKYREKHPKNPHFCPLFRCPFFDFHLANSWWFSVMHASAFLIRETKIGSSLCSVFPLRIFMGACNQGRKVLEFYCGVVTRRHSFGFSRNNMKGALPLEKSMGAEVIKKEKFLIFRFGVVKILGWSPNV